ncbi:hypothetical protein B6933_00880 [Campylobacter jejuni]|nr:hypothetical protein [Campylobacter jejuni]ECS0878368.1 hypothetical protein [Campylobacter coli]EAK5224366.1 hypothetical protein [Campylobacter jejuni]EAK6211344.1 hypothetical protein [Campylobacter jejuni]ECK5814609.1 hypothetical protein [Campylobacter jejuni]
MKNVIIIGAGGFARELYSYLKDANYEIIGYIDIQENIFFDLKYLGNEDNFDKKLIQKASFALGVGQINLRKKPCKTFKKNHVILSLLYILNLLFQKKLK